VIHEYHVPSLQFVLVTYDDKGGDDEHPEADAALLATVAHLKERGFSI
jgi:hypothetical protein